MTRVLLAPDKFKGTLSAVEVAAFLADGMPADVVVTAVPVADGGDGLLDAFASAGFDRVPMEASDALGRTHRTAYVRRGDQAVIELAAVCGLADLGDQLAPLTATSRGVGEVIAAALDAGCTHIVVGIGGSASTDGGLGMVQALGARAVDVGGDDVAGDALGAERAAKLDLGGLDPRLRQVQLEIACDVDNPLTGPSGAAEIYAPQKGADHAEVLRLDAALDRWATVVAEASGADHRLDPGAGAAGGVGFAAVAVLGGVLRPGAQVVLDALGFPAALAQADLVVTGEGSLDEQTLRGKAPAVVAGAARAAGVPVVAVAGRCLLDDERLHAAGFAAVHTLLAEAGSAHEALTAPGPLLRRIGARITEDWR